MRWVWLAMSLVIRLFGALVVATGVYAMSTVDGLSGWEAVRALVFSLMIVLGGLWFVAADVHS